MFCEMCGKLLSFTSLIQGLGTEYKQYSGNYASGITTIQELAARYELFVKVKK